MLHRHVEWDPDQAGRAAPAVSRKGKKSRVSQPPGALQDKHGLMLRMKNRNQMSRDRAAEGEQAHDDGGLGAK
jgi:hypothetical protein